MSQSAGHSGRRIPGVTPPITNPVITRVAQALPNQTKQPLPAPTGPSPYHLSLDSVLPAASVQAIQTAGKMSFHIAGDTGGVKAPQSQQLVVSHMENDFSATDPTARPAFFYNLRDVVYYYGQASEYYAQFYDPYVHYPAPIFAIPGNNGLRGVPQWQRYRHRRTTIRYYKAGRCCCSCSAIAQLPE